jgi:hypothetical protein
MSMSSWHFNNPNHNFIAPDTISYHNLYKILFGGYFNIGYYYVLNIYVGFESWTTVRRLVLYYSCPWAELSGILRNCIALMYENIIVCDIFDK